MSWTKAVVPFCGLLVLVSCTFLSLEAQQSPTYAEEYALYQRAQAETNQQKQKELALEFVRTYKQSELDPHISYLYQQYLKTLKDGGRWQELAKAAEEFLQYRPADASAAALAVEAYQKLGQPQKLVEFGTRLYNQNPNAPTAYLVAKACQSVGDMAGFEKWAERTLRHDPDNLEMLATLIQSAWTAQNLQKAAEYGQRALKALANAPDNEANNQVRAFAYRAIGENAYIQNDFPSAQSAFEEAARLDPKVDFAHLRLGYCYWRTAQLDKAIVSFARAVALSGPGAQEARQQLYTLLRQRFGNTSAATRYIDAAKQELGLK